MATPSPMNDPRFRTGPLSLRPAMPVGGEGMTPRRRMEQLGRRALTEGDDRTALGVAQTLFNADTYGARFAPRMSAPGLPPMPRRLPPGLPPMGAGQGLSDPLPPLPDMDTQPGSFNPPSPMPAPPEMLPPLEAPMFMPPPLPAPRMPDGALDISRPLPPSTLLGGAGVPAGPVYDNKNPLPLIPSPQDVTKFGLQPDFSKPQTYNGKQFPTFTKPPAAESQRWQLYDAPGPMVPHPYLKDQMIPGPPIKRQVDPITGETRDLVEEGTARGTKPAAGQAAPQTDAQAPGWLDWLKGKTAKK